MAACHYTTEGGRGTNNPLQHKPLMQQDWSYPWRGHVAAFWSRMASFWEHPKRHLRRIEALVGNMPPDAVEATALHLKAQGIEASSPQDFLCALGSARAGLQPFQWSDSSATRSSNGPGRQRPTRWSNGS
ncbi:unnamed protein product [Symbiodinium sp. CCMP2592]|nr:unnamed protein product [Symbiodinium sp. CCMP2592]